MNLHTQQRAHWSHRSIEYDVSQSAYRQSPQGCVLYGFLREASVALNSKWLRNITGTMSTVPKILPQKYLLFSVCSKTFQGTP